MKLGFCHLGFRVCSVRHVWYVTKRPSKEEAAEGDQSPLERETAIPANWMGRAQPAGREASSLCFYMGPCVQPERRPAPQGMLGCYDLFLGGCVHPKWQPFPRQTGVGCSITNASSILILHPSGVPPASKSVWERGQDWGSVCRQNLGMIHCPLEGYHWSLA